MSLQTDRIFYKALRANTSLMATLGNRLYNTAIPMPEEQAQNTPAPYVIISFLGFSNDQSTKDSYEGDIDHVQVGITIIAEDRKKLGALVDTIRTTIESYCDEATPDMEDFGEVPTGYALTGTDILYDEKKPAVHMQLLYACDVNK